MNMVKSEPCRVSWNSKSASKYLLILHAAWIDSVEETDEQSLPSRVTDLLLPAPPQAHSAQHHYSPTKPERRRSQDGYVESDDDVSRETMSKLPERIFFGGPKGPDKGRKWDHVREGEPVIVQSGTPDISSRWRKFVKSSMYGPPLEEDRKLVDTSFLEEQTPGYTRPWRGDLEGDDPEKLLGLRPSKRRRRVWYERIQVRMPRNCLVSLLLTFSSISLLCIHLFLFFSELSFLRHQQLHLDFQVLYMI